MATVLYTPDILALAISLSDFPLDDRVPLRAVARSRSCGSTLELGLALDDMGKVNAVGLRCQACAIGQASAAIFAEGVSGRSRDQIVGVARDMVQWIEGHAAMPDWPGLDVLAPAREYPARHGAALLVWHAALKILSSDTTGD